jgi:sulfate/thiosulfate transport system substrate-binding protein
MVRRRIAAAAAALGIAVPALAGCGAGSADSGGAGTVELALVAYSTPQAAYEKLTKAFQATPAGRNVRFTKSFGASGDQSRAVEAGLRADLVAFSLEPDMSRLVKAGLVAEDWKSGPTEGMITNSVVVIATRKGNPKGVKSWDDLTRPGIEVINPNPFTSGGARWNVMAAYGAKSDRGADQAAGVAYLKALFKNIVVQDDSARKSLQTFTSGKGDAILAYENEAIFARQNKQELDYTVPDATILIENPIAIAKQSRHPTEAKAFLDFLFSARGQQIFADNGYRPVVQGGTSFPTPSRLFTIADLGGWTKVNKDFFDTNTGIVADIERSLGVSVDKK